MLDSSNAVSLSTFEYLPLFHALLPNKHNPVIVTPIRNSRVRVSVELMRDEGLELLELDTALERYLINFYEFVRDELGFNYGFRVSVEGSSIHRGFTYVVITNSIARILAGRLTSEVYGFLKISDSRLGVPESVTALRMYEKFGDAYIWRYDEDVVKVGGFEVSLKSVSPILNFTYRDSITGSERVSNMLTHLIGAAVIEIYNALGGRDLKTLYDHVNLLSKIWEIIYVFEDGLHPSRYTSNNLYIYVQDLDRVLLIGFELRL